MSILPQSQCGRESSTLIIERIVILLLAAAMMVIVVSQDSREKMRLTTEVSLENHPACELSRSLNCWLDTSFGRGEAAFDGHNRVFTFYRYTHQCSPGLARVMSSLKPQIRIMEKPSSIVYDLLLLLQVGECQQSRPGDRLCRTIALLTLGTCVLLYGCRQIKPRRASPLQERLAKQRLNWKSMQLAVILFGGGCLVLTALQLRFSQHNCSQFPSSGFRMGTMVYEGQILSTCTFDGPNWGLPRLITVFGVEQYLADRISRDKFFWREPNVQVIAQPKLPEARAVSGLWTNLTHPRARTVDAVTLCYGFFYPLGILIWRRRQLLAATPRAKSFDSAPDDFQQVLNNVLQAPTALSMPKARFAEMLEIQLAPGLLPLSGLPDFKLERFRLHLSTELGIECPRVKFRPNQNLANTGYSIRVREVEVASGQLFATKWLAIGSQSYLEQLTGASAENPVLGLPGRWVDGEEVACARSLGCLVLSPSQILMTHLELTIRAQAWQLMGHQDTFELLQALSQTHHSLVKDVFGQFEVSTVKQVLQRLLREQVSLRDLPLILETMLDSGQSEVVLLTEAVRCALGRNICLGLMGSSHCLNVITLDPAIEQALKESDTSAICDFFRELEDEFRSWSGDNAPVLLTSPEMRPPIREIVSRGPSDLTVLSWAEIPSGIKVEVRSLLSF